jgi:pyruvate/2-oxoglutarate dehydrogenase complex dihydrolipoamide dehydrogenase (E3) component
MTGRIETDLCVIGAGSGGLSVAAGAVQMGARVVLLEGGEMGGDCLNTGCVPSKALLAAGKHAHALGTGGGFGVAPVKAEIDFAGAQDHVARTIASIAPHDSQERFEALGVTVIRAYGRFISRTEVAAGDAVIAARRFVIATGSRPAIPPIPGLAEVPYDTNETIFALPERPRHLLILGGGPIGVEMAQAHRRLGSAVTMVEAARALGREDPEAAAVVLTALRAEGIDIHEDSPAERVSGAAGAITLHLQDGASVTGSHLLVATGRQVITDALGLDRAGIARNDRGIKTDAGLRTSNRRVYAIGDAAGGAMFTHLAGYHAGVVIRSALLGLPARARNDHIPRTTYTDPELAQVGLTEAEARRRYGTRLDVVRADFAENDRARAEGRTEGFLKLMIVRGRPIGATLVGAGAGELIQLWALAIANRLKLSAITAMVAPYPTLGEISKRAAGAWFAPRLFDSAMVKRIVRLVQRL